jgi:HK97 family phage major capsid protein
MTTAIPTNPEALGTYLTEDIRNKISTDPAFAAQQFKAFGEAYAAEWAKTHAGKTAVADIAAAKELELIQYLEDHGNELPKGFKAGEAMAQLQQKRRGMGLTNTRTSKGQLWDKRALGAKVDDKFTSAWEYFAAVHATGRPQFNVPNKQDMVARLLQLQEIQNSYGSIVPSDGGFLIPEILRSEILQLALPTSIVRARATVIQMDSLKVPIPAVDERSRVTSIFGGLQFFWAAEGAPGVDSSAKFGQVTLDAKKLMGYAGIPNELMLDAPAFMSWFSAKFPAGITWFEDIAFLTGDGVTQPLGVTQGSGVVSVTRTTTGTIRYEDLVAMYQSMYPASIPNSCWVMSHDAFAAMAELYFIPNSGGGGTIPVPVMLWIPNAVGDPTPTILGRPVIFTEKIGPLGFPAGGTTDVMFVDFSEYLVGDRQMMQVESSADYLFGTDKTAFRAIERVDGRPWLPAPITPHNNSSIKLTPYVALAH